MVDIYVYCVLQALYVYIYICVLKAKNTHCDGSFPNVFDVPLMMVLWEPKHVRLLESEEIKSSLVTLDGVV
jgi:hypothetical protein